MGPLRTIPETTLDAMQRDPNAAAHNFLLKSLPAHSLTALLEHATVVALPADAVLYEPSVKPRYGHFLLSGLAELTLPMEDGTGVECGLIGCEGLPEGPHLQGPGPILTRCDIQAPALALRLRFDDLQKLFDHDAALHKLVLEFNQAQASISCQSASCNAQHDAGPRLARLLLMTADRTSRDGSDQMLPVTQEDLAGMLGSRRTTVTVIAGELQRQGLIDYARGHLVIVDRTGLEKMACECYRETRRIYHGLYGRKENDEQATVRVGV